MEDATHTSRAALRPGTAEVKISAGLDCEAVSPLGSVVMPRSASFTPQTTAGTQAQCPRVVFGVAAGFCMFQLWVQEGAAASTLAASHPDSVAESFLNVGNVVVRRQDTSRARVQVVQPLMGDLREAQVFHPCHLLPSTLGEECVLQTPETSPISEP